MKHNVGATLVPLCRSFQFDGMSVLGSAVVDAGVGKAAATLDVIAA